MKSHYRVILSEEAISDIISIGRWIAEEAGREISHAYVGRVHAACLKLGDFPRRGRPREDLARGVRTFPFEGRVIIAYRVDAEEVSILRVISGARDMERLFEEE